ncbi:hypothetical protein Efla_004996 [Eimeria flavescens]
MHEAKSAAVTREDTGNLAFVAREFEAEATPRAGPSFASSLRRADRQPDALAAPRLSCLSEPGDRWPHQRE